MVRHTTAWGMTEPYLRKKGGKKTKSCLEGIDEALMMGYDVKCEIKGAKKSIIRFEQHPDYRTALTFGIDNEKMEREISRLWNEDDMSRVVKYPIRSSNDAKEVIEWLEDSGYQVGKVVN